MTNHKKHKYVKTKQYATKQLIDHWRNQKENQEIPRDKWQWRYNNPKPMEHSQAVLRGKFIAIQAYLRKQEKSQINNLSLHLKQLEKEEQTKLKFSKMKETTKIRAKIEENYRKDQWN